MKSKLGFHIDVQTHPGQVEKMVAAQPKVIKVIHSMGLLQHLYNDTLLGYDTTFVARVNVAHESFPNYMQGTNPKSAALRWFNETLPYLKQARFAYWESFNEMTSWDWLQAYGEFEAERQRIMHEEGFKACVGNFAVGTPNINSWDKFYSALETCSLYSNILGLHEYGGLYMSMWYERNQTPYIRTFPDFDRFPDSYGEGWLFGRYRKVWNEHIFPNNWNSIRIVLTEFGFDGVATQDTQWLSVGTITGSWKTCVPVWARLDAERGGGNGPQFYVKNLQCTIC